MSAEKKVCEGNECIAQAEKYLKTSFLKWKPDYDSAALEYSKAATCFKAAKVLGQCKDCFLKAAECYRKNNSFFSAAKNYEQAAMIYKEMEDYQNAVQLIERACQLFREHGTPDTAALALEKGAKMIESKCPEMALELYKKAMDVVMTEDRPTQASEHAAKASKILIRLKRFDEAVNMVRKEQEFHLATDNTRAVGRLVVSEVLIHLMREDYVAADKAFKEGYHYCERDESNTLMDLLEGYDQGDAEQLNRALNSPFIKHMDVEYARLARSLLVPETEKNEATQKASASASTAANDEEDEFAGGLL
ncbi:Gamma-soluble NSF attachment protein [Araneus ventricosus]|uniref:Gamma-soluble NSF attachment protein n=1 Tax=Araneus ventricosus TaxID=182803 RepID=A0A4Y2PGX8_ARAVE|nr:Gamma-soluble NSF attachment protein [Araneus ventricosus]GBN50210.1 Gamma-soluble NSF attachment protein [Araneus ventricosus]